MLKSDCNGGKTTFLHFIFVLGKMKASKEAVKANTLTFKWSDNGTVTSVIFFTSEHFHHHLFYL